jgi:glycerophosphoryl diester phosphodiesterase
MAADFPTPVWISHRGGRSHCPENTLAAFRGAVRQGFAVLETDLRISRDGHIVLSHDPTLLRLCGDRRRIHDLSRAELLRIPLPGGSRLLFFDEFIADFSGIRWVFDVKPEHGPETLQALSRWAAANRATDLVRAGATFLVWQPRHQRMLHRLFPGAALYPGKQACIRAGVAALLNLPAGGCIRPGKTYGLPPRLGRLTLYREPIVHYYRRRGAKLLAFLPETEADAREALRLGFDEILTDHDIVTPG